MTKNYKLSFMHDECLNFVPDIVISRGVKTYALPNGLFLHFWYANNKGNGTSNCTIIKSGAKTRACMSAKQTNILSQVKTSSWQGKVNFSSRIRKELGL